MILTIVKLSVTTSNQLLIDNIFSQYLSSFSPSL
jgi:hypothetical protein